MKIKVYNYLLMLSAALLLGSRTNAMQIESAEPAPVTDSFSKPDLSKLRLKMDKLHKLDFKKQTFAMQKSFRHLQESMSDLGTRISTDFNDSFSAQNNTQPYNYQDNVQDGDIVKVKNYSKSYSADSNDQLDLSNTYGRITVNTWARNEVKVDVQIKASANRESVAQDGIDMVSIDDNKDGNVISFRTRINNNSNWGRSDHHKIDVNYIVYMPAKMQLDVKNNYGTIILPDLSGLVRVKANYTNVSTKRLSNPMCELAGNYGNFTVAELNGGRINVNYGNVTVEDANNLKINVNYGNLSLGTVKGAMAINLAYVGDLKIAEVNNDLRNLNIHASYSTLNLGVAPRSNFRFDVVTTYADFKYDEDKVNITERVPEPGSRGSHTTKVYRGVFGKGSPDAEVRIVSTYGGVTFN